MMASEPAQPSAPPGGRPGILLGIRLAIATLLGVGKVPWISGTFGTLASIPIYLALAWPGSTAIYLWGTAALTLIAVWGCHAAERHYGSKDPGEAVADEMAGFLVTMAFFPLSAGPVILGFFVFRAMDIIKPFPARRLERLPGGWGIVADDVFAGVWANVFTRLGLAVLAWAFSLLGFAR